MLLRQSSHNRLGLWTLSIPHIYLFWSHAPIYSSSPQTHRKRWKEVRRNAIRGYAWILRVERVGFDRDFISYINFISFKIFNAYIPTQSKTCLRIGQNNQKEWLNKHYGNYAFAYRESCFLLRLNMKVSLFTKETKYNVPPPPRQQQCLN